MLSKDECRKQVGLDARQSCSACSFPAHSSAAYWHVVSQLTFRQTSTDCTKAATCVTAQACADAEYLGRPAHISKKNRFLPEDLSSQDALFYSDVESFMHGTKTVRETVQAFASTCTARAASLRYVFLPCMMLRCHAGATNTTQAYICSCQ